MSHRAFPLSMPSERPPRPPDRVYLVRLEYPDWQEQIRIARTRTAAEAVVIRAARRDGCRERAYRACRAWLIDGGSMSAVTIARVEVLS